MTDLLNETHDPTLRSWVQSANAADTDFPIQNLPFGVFRRTSKEGESQPRVGVAIGDHVVDIHRCEELGLFAGDAAPAAEACRQPTLNALMALDPAAVSALRKRLSRLLADSGTLDGDKALVSGALVPMADVRMQLPAAVGDYTDFYCSIHHATNIGTMFRPDNPLMPNYKHLPVGYHGRSSSLVTSATPVRRPHGQSKAPDAPAPSFGPSQLLDYELEVGFFVGPGNNLGESITIDDAESHLFGYCLVNDWSARDIQGWEYQPLGPFLGKSFATSLAPWVITTEALAPFRVPAIERDAGDPTPLAHLAGRANRTHGGIDMVLEVYLASQAMRDAGTPPMRLSRGNFRDLYWTPAQMLTHHASNGCNLRSGDLLASGTVSGASKDARGCLMELTWRGSEPITLPSGEIRRFLDDGDQLTIRGHCAREGAMRIGMGSVTGVVLPARGLEQG